MTCTRLIAGVKHAQVVCQTCPRLVLVSTRALQELRRAGSAPRCIECRGSHEAKGLGVGRDRTDSETQE